MDETGELFSFFAIRSFPTTFMLDKDGNVYGYLSGMMSKDMMEDVIRQTQEAN